MNQFPQLWTMSAEAAGLEQRLRAAPRSVLMLDYDGTLAPFHVDRFAATPYPGVEERLATLSALPRVRLVLVSGRSARELRDLLRPGIRAEIWGSHGREQLRSDGSYELFALNPVQQAALEQVGLEMSALGFSETLEVKPASLAIHWRSFEPAMQEQIRSSVQSSLPALTQADGLHLLPFDGGLELRSTDRTKGTAVGEILVRGAGCTSRWPTWATISPMKTLLPPLGTGVIPSWYELRFASRSPGFGYARQKSCWSSWTRGSQTRKRPRGGTAGASR